MFKCLGPKDQNCIHEKMSSCLKMKIITYKTIIVPIGILHLRMRTD